MPDWGKLLMAYAEGANPEMFAKARAQKEEMINNEQRRNLLASQEGRAQANEARESEQNTYNIGRRGSKEKAEELALTQAGLSVDEARLVLDQKRKQDAAYELAGGSRGQADETIAERKRKDQDQRNEAARLALDTRRTSMAEELGALEGMTREEQLKEAQRKNRFGGETYQGAVEAENYNNSEEARLQRQQAQAYAGLRNAGDNGPAYDAIAADLLEIQERKKQRREAATNPTQKPAKERAGSSAGAWSPRKGK